MSLPTSDITLSSRETSEFPHLNPGINALAKWTSNYLDMFSPPLEVQSK